MSELKSMFLCTTRISFSMHYHNLSSSTKIYLFMWEFRHAKDSIFQSFIAPCTLIYNAFHTFMEAYYSEMEIKEMFAHLKRLLNIKQLNTYFELWTLKMNLKARRCHRNIFVNTEDTLSSNCHSLFKSTKIFFWSTVSRLNA